MKRGVHMRTLGNILWFLLGGFELGLVFLVEGIALLLTIIGIPFGLQWFKILPLVFCPFGKGIRYPKVTGGGVLGNILWVLFIGWWNAIACLLLGVVFCVTIVGIPFGLQWFKLARMLFLPFGAEVYNEAAEKKQEKMERKLEKQQFENAKATKYAQNNNAAPKSYVVQNSRPVANDTPPVAPAQPQYIAPAAVATATVALAADDLWTCLICGRSDNKNGANFCEGCGCKKTVEQIESVPYVDVDFKEKVDDNDTWVCPNCGKADSAPEALFCEGCGYPKTAQQEENTAYSEEVVNETVDAAVVWICPNCGKADSAPEALFCEGCGCPKTAQQVENTAYSEEVVNETVADAVVWICPNCGTSYNEFSGIFCENCGYKKS